jgi:polar amino acid transport system substrate-binding protein
MLLALFCITLTTMAVRAVEPVKLVTWDWPPYTSRNLDGYGFVTEIISLILEEIEEEPEYEFFPWKMAETLLKQGKAWAAFPYAYTNARAKKFLFSDVIIQNAIVFFYLKQEERHDYDGLEALEPFTLGGVKGSSYEKELEDAGLNVTYTLDEVSALKLLVDGEVDFVIMDLIVGWTLLRQHFPKDEDRVTTMDTPYLKSDSRLMVSQDYPNAETLLNAFNRQLQRIKASKLYSRILQKYDLGDRRKLRQISW